MTEWVHLSVDAMGGDLAPQVPIEACLAFLNTHDDIKISLVGDEKVIRNLVSDQYSNRLNIVSSTDVITMEDVPSVALRQKRDSSMWRAIELVTSGHAQGVVSGGNTGALMGISKHLSGVFQGIKRPAICKPIPAVKGTSYLLDLGANLDCDAEQLVQFALMGSALARVYGHTLPTVALLNVGEEKTKGSEAIRSAAKLLAQDPRIEFRGFIEGDRLYSGDVNVVVCDGFVGNVALKVSEGVASLLFPNLQKRLQSGGWRAWLANKLVGSIVKQWFEHFYPARYNGAALLGLHDVVVKSHGSADVEGFFAALTVAKEQIVHCAPSSIENCLLG